MLTKTIVSAGALLSMVAAVPMQQQPNNKRDIVYTTKVEQEVVTVDVTTTVWLEPGETPTAQATPAAQAPQQGHGHGHKHGHGQNQPHPQPEPQETVPTVPAEASPAATHDAPSPPPPAVEPSPNTPKAPKPAPTQAAPPPPPAEPSPAEPSPAAPSPAAPSPEAPSSNGGSGGSAPSGETYTGEITYYTPGLGSCGITSSASEDIVALAAGMMTAAGGANPNENPLCGKKITISYGGTTSEATIVDTCPGCSGAGLDMSPTLFSKFAPQAEGRVSGVKWWYNN